MRANGDSERYQREPVLLLDLLRKVIASVVEATVDPEASQKEAQLREIARTMDRLKKAGVPVPESLRGEKMHLTAKLAAGTHRRKELNQLADGLEGILDGLKSQLRRGGSGQEQKKALRKRSKTLKHGKAELRERILGRLHEVVSEAKAAGMTAQEIKAICTASFAIDAEPYGETPASILAMAKGKKS